MGLQIFTSQLRCSSADRLDVTRSGADRARNKGQDAPGHPFAPSWDILNPVLKELAHASRMMTRNARYATQIESTAWSKYEREYVGEMRVSYVVHRKAWDELLARKRVVLCCVCPVFRAESGRCHRRLLAHLLTRCRGGAVDHGELPKELAHG